MRRPYTASGQGVPQDRVGFNIQRAESLLDEPDTGFSLGGATPAGYGGGFGGAINQGITSGAGRIGTGRGFGGRSNYTASEFGEDETPYNASKPSWLAGGNSPALGGGNYGGGSLAGATEIGTVDFAGSRRSGRFAGGNTSQASNSGQNQNPRRLRGENSNSGYERDILETEMNRNDGGMSRQRSTNLLSDAGSKAGYRDDDDLMSHYMGQSAYGGASNIGVEVGSNAGDRYGAHQHSTQQAESGGRSRSRRQEVAERNNLNIGSSSIPDSRRNERLTAGQKPQETRNYGLFLGGPGSAQGDKQSDGVRSRSEHTRALGVDQGNTIGSNESGAFRRAGPDILNTGGAGFQRERSFPPSRPVPFDVQKEDAVSTHSKEPVKSAISSPIKTDAVSIVDNKKEYLKEKKRKDLEALQTELEKEKLQFSKTDEDLQNQIENLKEKQQKELESVEQSHKETISLLNKEKDKIMGTLHEAVEREHNKMEQLHRADLDAKDRLHQENLESLKTQLQKETDTLEGQLNQQQELREIIERVQKRTVDIGEIVQSSLRQREDELKRKEIDMAKMERDMLEDETIYIELEEKKLAEEERKLQSRKDVLLKLKQTQNEEINSMRRQRQNALENNQKDEDRLRQEERNAKEQLAMAKKTLEQENERRSAQNRLFEVEIQNKESELQNANQLFEKEKKELEQEQRENYIRDIQARQIEIEDRKKVLANNEYELRKEQRMLEKKHELIQADALELEEKKQAFATEKLEFEVQAQRIQETSEKLQEEGAKVWEEKAVFDADKEQLDKIGHDINLERSLLQAELLKAEELEHELIHRENMLKMLQFNKDTKDKANNNTGLLPPYTSCPNLKMENAQTFIQTLSPGGELYDRQQYVQQNPQIQPMMTPAMQYSDVQTNRFDYNRYMVELQNKLGSNTMFSGDKQWSNAFQNNMNAYVDEFAQQVGYPDRGNVHDVMSEDNQHLSPSNARPGIEVLDPGRGQPNSVTKSGRGFREKILAQLGNAQLEDSKFNSNSEGYQDEGEMSGVMFNQMQGSHGEYNNAQNMGAEMGYDSEV